MLFIFVCTRYLFRQFITDCCSPYLRPPRLAPAICRRKWTLCKWQLLIIIKCPKCFTLVLTVQQLSKTLFDRPQFYATTCFSYAHFCHYLWDPPSRYKPPLPNKLDCGPCLSMKMPLQNNLYTRCTWIDGKHLRKIAIRLNKTQNVWPPCKTTQTLKPTQNLGLRSPGLRKGILPYTLRNSTFYTSLFLYFTTNQFKKQLQYFPFCGSLQLNSSTVVNVKTKLDSFNFQINNKAFTLSRWF